MDAMRDSPEASVHMFEGKSWLGLNWENSVTIRLIFFFFNKELMVTLFSSHYQRGLDLKLISFVSLSGSAMKVKQFILLELHLLLYNLRLDKVFFIAGWRINKYAFELENSMFFGK